MLFSVTVCCQLFAQTAVTGSQTIYTININKPDTIIRAEVMAQRSSALADKDLTYYWYANVANTIIQTKGGFDGKLLHGAYTSFYGNNNLKEKGKFDNGIKNGEWIKWYSNGAINEVSHWRLGMKNGRYKLYNEQGEQMLGAHFRNDKMEGTVKTYQNGKVLSRKKYRNGQELPGKLDIGKKKFKITIRPLRNKIKNLFKKKDSGNNPKKESEKKRMSSSSS